MVRLCIAQKARIDFGEELQYALVSENFAGIGPMQMIVKGSLELGTTDQKIRWEDTREN